LRGQGLFSARDQKDAIGRFDEDAGVRGSDVARPGEWHRPSFDVVERGGGLGIRITRNVLEERCRAEEAATQSGGEPTRAETVSAAAAVLHLLDSSLVWRPGGEAVEG